ncbi:hypothetical protein BOTNAR_0002g00560 [Botryotinia narcissicola]|uniref:Uncharacterized protein n=1 Tax=Botryotinia narcissicola TaxID=278944 RepID=A0A4Z1JG06_9HELO|nr:hypothetical protein BOTNAR_0002g00560 [Botryotinia narcissicola]
MDSRELPKYTTKPIMPPGIVDMFALLARGRAQLVSIMEARSSRNTNKSLSPTEKGVLLALAGTESPAKTLSIVVYPPIANPAILDKLLTELISLPDNVTWTQLEQLPYLPAVIEERIRLAFGATPRTARISYGTLTYTLSQHVINPVNFGKSYVILLGTPVSTTTLSAHAAASVVLGPFTFEPERW